MQFQVVLRTPINQDPTNDSRWAILPDFHSYAKCEERWAFVVERKAKINPRDRLPNLKEL